MGEINTVVNCFHYRSLKLMSRMAAVLGFAADAEFFLTRAKKVRQSINKKLFNKATGLYIDCEGESHSSLHANMFPLAFDIVPEKAKPDIIAYLKSRGMACSVYGAHYLLEALYKAGEAQYALDLMTATGKRSWFHMINDLKTTVTTEAWDVEFKNNMDWNHAWGAAPASVIPRFLLGVRPQLPGCEKITVNPQIGNLVSVKGKIPTIRGTVYVSVERSESEYKLDLRIPGNVSADVYVPAFAKDCALFLNGKRLKGAREGKFIKIADVAAGHHIVLIRKEQQL